MHIVFPDGAACLQSREDLLPLEKIGTVQFHETQPQTKAELIRRLRDADLVILDYSVVDAEVLRQCPNLKFICFLGIGYANYIDVAAATERGVTVTYTPGYGAVGVAEYTLGLVLSLTRHIVFAHESMKRGAWEPARFQGMELQGKCLGIVGLGPIGVEMSRLAAGIGMNTLGWTRNAVPERATHGLTLVSLDELFVASDIVSIHLSHTAQTERLISRTLLEKMKPGAFFINTARAKLVDNQALAELLQQGRIAGAALDVHEEEPAPPNYLFVSLPNVLLTPHIGFNSKDAARKMLRIAYATLEAFVRGEKLHVVNPV
ncbi:MAG TPA: NAD(P)-dependent oxidoreductase [archaeon]|nr:NAD(P)-dependent oxidoreductase [archaeon]